jgi:hypothetical protein
MPNPYWCPHLSNLRDKNNVFGGHSGSLMPNPVFALFFNAGNMPINYLDMLQVSAYKR